MTPYEESFAAYADIMTVVAHSKRIGWETIDTNTIHRSIYLMKVLFSFTHEDENLFGIYHFNVSIFGPYSELINRALYFLLSSQRLLGEVGGALTLNSGDGVDCVTVEKQNWIDTVLLILGKYGERKVFSFVVNDPQYGTAVKSNAVSEIDCGVENETLKILRDFQLAFEQTLPDTSSISKAEYLNLYFDYIFSQIIKA